jgi:hypothetical protein
MLIPKAIVVVVWALVFGLAIGLPLGWGFSQFRQSSQVPRQTTEPPAQGQSGHAQSPETYWERLTIDPIASGTLLLCLITGVLARYTYRLFRVTADLARDTKIASDKALAASTEATNLARQDFVATHRPRIRLREFRLVELGSGRLGVRCTLTNIGSGKALIGGMGAKVRLFVRDELPPVDYMGTESISLMKTFRPGALDEQVTISCPIATEKLKEAIEYRDLYVFGYVAYRDEMDNGYMAAFCRRYDRFLNRFRVVDDPDYEYEG